MPKAEYDSYANEAFKIDIVSTPTDENPETRWWFQVPHLRMLALKMFIVALCSSNTGYITSCLASISSLPSFLMTLEAPSTTRISTVTSGLAFGTLVTAPFASHFSDIYGRKNVILSGQVITIIGTLIQGFAPNFGAFLTSRIIIGMGIGLYAVAAPILLAETAYPKHRAAVVFSYGTCYHFGAMFATWIIFGTRLIQGAASWKIPSFLQAVFPVVSILLLKKVPESPRYFVAQGKTENARVSLFAIHNSTRKAEMELKEIESAISIEGMAQAPFDFVKPKYLKRFYLVVFISTLPQLCTNGITSTLMYQFMTTMTMKSVNTQLAINGALYVVNFIVVAIINVISGFVKRRILFIISLIGMLICYVIWLIFAVITERGNYVNKWTAAGAWAFILLYSVLNFIGMSGMPYVYVTEVAPYKLRSKAAALMQIIMAAVTIYNSFVHTIALSTIHWKYYMVFVPIYTILIPIFYFTVPEIAKTNLEHVASVFETLGDNSEADSSKPVSFKHVERV